MLLCSCAVFVAIMLSAYEGSLRASLMKVDYERAVDSDKDLMDLGQKLYLPAATPFLMMYLSSPVKVLLIKLDCAGHQCALIKS